MKVTCGTDIIEISRVKESIEKLGDRFLNRVFTEEEIKYCESRGKSKFEHYAGRFAVKEAAFKAVSGVLEDKYQIVWKDIECLNDENGRPFVTIFSLNNNKIEGIDVSISHCRQYATANVVIVFK